MIKPEMIPDEVVEAAAKAYHNAWRGLNGVTHETMDWEALDRAERTDIRIQVKAAIAAALAAWPGARKAYADIIKPHGEMGPRIGVDPRIVLPLPTENSDE